MRLQYSMALVGAEMDSSRQKTRASDKLALRLNSRKQPLDKEGTDGSSALNADKNTEDSVAAMLAIKAEKLREHKLQEARVKQDMSLAKGRSAMALQKRLDEMAAKRAALLGPNHIDADPNDEEDDDSVDED